MELIGQRIRRARELRGLSQEDFASEVGKDQRAVSEYERGKRRVPANDLPLFADVLDVPVMFFFADIDDPKELEPTLLKEFYNLPTPEARRTAIEFIRLLARTLDEHTS